MSASDATRTDGDEIKQKLAEIARIANQREGAKLASMREYIDHMVDRLDDLQPLKPLELIGAIREFTAHRDEALQYLMELPDTRPAVVDALITTPREWWIGGALVFNVSQLALTPAEVVRLMQCGWKGEQTDHPLYAHLDETLQYRMASGTRVQYREYWDAILRFYELSTRDERIPSDRALLHRLIEELYMVLRSNGFVRRIDEEYREIKPDVCVKKQDADGKIVESKIRRPGWNFAVEVAVKLARPVQQHRWLYSFWPVGEMILQLAKHFETRA